MNVAEIDIQKKKRSTGKDYRFSIIIPSWNNLQYLQLCIRSIKKNSTFNHQIIVHVNEGDDGTIEWVKSQTDIDYSFSEKNIGVCYALNYAASLACTDYILFMNDDMYACPDWDGVLLKQVESIGHKNFFFSSTMIEPYETGNACVIQKNYGTSVADFDEQRLLNEFQSLHKDDWLGATWPPNIVHKDVWEAVGGYSTEFHPGMYSDPDFSMKLWNMGIRIFKGIGGSKVYHFSGLTTVRVKKNKGYYTFIKKWGMSSGYAMKYILHRGEKYNGILPDPENSFIFSMKNFFKRATALFN